MSKLKEIRDKLNITQEELAEKSGISVRTIQRIESGAIPKGYTLKTLSKALDISEKELLEDKNDESIEDSSIDLLANSVTPIDIDFQKVKWINLSSLPFIIFPPFNIFIPLLLSFVFKQKNLLTKQIISLQILWTICAPIIFMMGIFLKLGRSFTVVLLITIVLSNVFLILRNLAEIDRKQKMFFKLNFSII